MPITAKQLVDINVNESYERFYKSLETDYGLTWAEWISDNTFINGNPFSWRGYEYLIEPVNDNFSRQAIKKPAQVGASEAFQRKMVAILYRYAMVPHYYEENGEEYCLWGINSIYSFPDADNLRRFVKDRFLTDLVWASPVLAEASKKSASEAADLVGFYNSFCYFTGRRTYGKNQSTPAEVIMVDEYDLPLNVNRKAIGALFARTQNAKIFRTPKVTGMIINYGTPTYPDEEGILIDGQFHLSDQKWWHVKCTHCNHWQIVEYPDSIAYFWEKGEKNPFKDKTPYYMCRKCHRPLDYSVIGDWHREEPNKYKNAEWVAKYPERTADGSGIRGYQISFATYRNTAELLLTRRDKDYRSPADFNNYGLGFAYMDDTIGIDEADFLRNTNEQIMWGERDLNHPHIMGIDQGCYWSVARLLRDSQTAPNPFGVWIVVACGYVKDAEAFSKVVNENGQLKVVSGKLSELIEYWRPEAAVIDRLPNVASAEAELALFPDTIWLNDSKGTFGERVRYEELDGNERKIHRITENKHLAIDEYFQQIRSRRWQYACNPGSEFATFKKHHKNIKKVISENQYFQYQSFGDDHFGMAGKYMSEAAEIYTTFRPQVNSTGTLILLGFREGRR